MRKTPQPKPITVYLRKERREERIKSLSELAAKYADNNLSLLVQKIADGELELQPRKQAS